MGRAGFLSLVFLITGVWGVRGEMVQTESVKLLAHEAKADDIEPVWMNPAEGAWIIGFARDSKTDRTQELGYWEFYGSLGAIMFSTHRQGYAGPRRSRSSANDYRFFSGYLCLSPIKPYRRLAYIHNHREIKVLGAGDLEKPDTLVTFEFQVNNLYLDWSAKDQLAFVSELTGQGDIYVADIPQRAVGKIGAAELKNHIRRLTRSAAHDGQPAWSPEGNRLAYEAKPEEINQDIYVIDDVEAALAVGGVEKGRRLTQFPSAEANPTWSPDGQMLAFYRIEGGEDERVDLWVVNADGTGAKEIARNVKRPSRNGPSWLFQAEVGHGRQVIYVIMATEGSKMFISDVESGESREVAIEARVISDVVASPGSDPYITFSAQDTAGRKRIYVKKLVLSGLEKQKKEWD